MDTFAPSSTDRVLPKVTALAGMPPAEFVARWRALTGEPPAAMLDDRFQMLVLLVKSVPASPPKLEAETELYDPARCNAPSDQLSSDALPSNILPFIPRAARSPAP